MTTQTKPRDPPPPRRLPTAIQSVACLAFLALATIAIFWRHLFAGYTFPFDYVATVRWPVFLTSNVQAGLYSEWIPFVGGGMPLPYNAASSLYFPVWWIAGWLGIPATVTMQSAVMAAHFFLGAAGVFLLSTSLGLDRKWALVAAAAFLLFGGHYSNGYLDMIMRGHTYAPWLLFSLTPTKATNRGWIRILTLPLWVWLLVSGAYPGQAMTFLQVGGVYAAVHLWLIRTRLKQILPYLLPAVAASLAIFIAAYLPSLLAERAGELYRPFPPSAFWRGVFSLQPHDIFGLYLNPFAWNEIPSIITGWSVGVVVLIGLTGLSKNQIREHAPLVVAGTVAFLLASLPSWPPTGRIMASMPLLFPSRLPASDSKALIAVALVCMSAFGWARIASGQGRKTPALAAGLGALLIAGLVLAPQYRQLPPARQPWLVVLVVTLAVCLILLRFRLQPRILFAAVLVLTLVEGSRLILEMEVYPDESAWALPPAEFPHRGLHDTQARNLSRQLQNPPARRPARVPEKSLEQTIEAHGHIEDALGYLGADYYLGDYASAITMARRNITLDPQLRAAMLEPWTAWIWPCNQTDCSGSPIEVPDLAGMESDNVRTASYGPSLITYEVSLSERSLMIENEIYAPGWSSDRPGIKPISVDGTLRGWVLPPGQYQFSVRYTLPHRQAQLFLAAAALASWALALILFLRTQAPARLTPPGSNPGQSPQNRQDDRL